MPGTYVTDQQVRLYMSKRKHHTQEVAAAMAGMSVRTARRIEHDDRLPSQKPPRAQSDPIGAAKRNLDT
ncbi:helix-turn-helix transcriptional regulator [Caballeronia sp. ATUFL_F1_KS39]|uniref:helix-turn-helix domain-containing protein n=1 Tax=Caballeronia sp. ATUFL_F1_KS39 TaxID=2921766 RepID=UPI002028BE84|nr:helix-turn-helix transcriptional regulator [Caballeronia sp. ATUFL_F1_KS39]